jgi:hypothetical protein
LPLSSFLHEVSFYLFSSFLNNSSHFHFFRGLFDPISPITPRQQAMTRYLHSPKPHHTQNIPVRFEKNS